jgi:hypothetical protein
MLFVPKDSLKNSGTYPQQFNQLCKIHPARGCLPACHTQGQDTWLGLQPLRPHLL